MLYTDNLDAGDASIYIEMGEGSAIPVKNALVTVDGVQHIVVDVLWDVYVTPSRTTEADRYPQQCATVLLRSKTRSKTRSKMTR